MTLITPELRRAIEQAGGGPVRIEDPETHTVYVLLKAEIDDRAKSVPDDDEEIPEGIKRSQDAFFRDLPELLKDESVRGRWICYCGDERIGIDDDDEPLIRECLRRGLKDDQYGLFVIGPQSRETEEVTFPSSWL